MKKLLLPLAVSAFILTPVGFAQNPPPTEAPAAPEAPAVKPHHEHEHGKAEHHQEIHKAMRKLRGAKADLEKAASDFGGHKAKAIEAIDRALEELKDAMGADKK